MLYTIQIQQFPTVQRNKQHTQSQPKSMHHPSQQLKTISKSYNNISPNTNMSRRSKKGSLIVNHDNKSIDTNNNNYINYVDGNENGIVEGSAIGGVSVNGKLVRRGDRNRIGGVNNNKYDQQDDDNQGQSIQMYNLAANTQKNPNSINTISFNQPVNNKNNIPNKNEHLGDCINININKIYNNARVDENTNNNGGSKYTYVNSRSKKSQQINSNNGSNYSSINTYGKYHSNDLDMNIKANGTGINNRRKQTKTVFSQYNISNNLKNTPHDKMNTDTTNTNTNRNSRSNITNIQTPYNCSSQTNKSSKNLPKLKNESNIKKSTQLPNIAMPIHIIKYNNLQDKPMKVKRQVLRRVRDVFEGEADDQGEQESYVYVKYDKIENTNKRANPSQKQLCKPPKQSNAPKKFLNQTPTPQTNPLAPIKQLYSYKYQHNTLKQNKQNFQYQQCKQLDQQSQLIMEIKKLNKHGASVQEKNQIQEEIKEHIGEEIGGNNQIVCEGVSEGQRGSQIHQSQKQKVDIIVKDQKLNLGLNLSTKKKNQRSKMKQFMQNLLSRTKIQQVTTIKRNPFGQSPPPTSNTRVSSLTNHNQSQQPNPAGSQVPVSRTQKKINVGKLLSSVRKSHRNLTALKQGDDIRLPNAHEYKGIVEMVKKEQREKEKRKERLAEERLSIQEKIQDQPTQRLKQIQQNIQAQKNIKQLTKVQNKSQKDLKKKQKTEINDKRQAEKSKNKYSSSITPQKQKKTQKPKPKVEVNRNPHQISRQKQRQKQKQVQKQLKPKQIRISQYRNSVIIEQEIEYSSIGRQSNPNVNASILLQGVGQSMGEIRQSIHSQRR